MKDMLLNFIKKTGKDTEFNLFLKLFLGLPKMKFGVIKISGATLEDNLDLIAQDIAFLNSLGIYPIIVHGAGSSLDKRLPNSKKINGVRVTSAEDMVIVKEVFSDLANKLKNNIIMHGGNAKIVEGVFECKPIEELGSVGKITAVNISPIKNAIDSNTTPIISPIGNDLNINADTAAKELVKIIGPKKFILITSTGGILDENGQIIPYLNLSGKFNTDNITGGMLLKVEEMADFSKSTPNCAVVITSAESLLKEMFTVKGSGTYIKYHLIHSYGSFDSIDKMRLKNLLENAFNKKLVDAYFDGRVEEIFLQEDYEGVAIVKKLGGFHYLDKFAVATSVQGTGLGTSLWDEVIKKYTHIIWRATPQNPSNQFYVKECDGMVKGNEWVVYWKGIGYDKVYPLIEMALRKEKTMVK